MVTPTGVAGESGTGTLLLASCAARVVAVLWAFTYVSDPDDDADSMGVPLTLFFVLAGAASVLMVLQRPWTGRAISGKQWRKIGLSGTGLATTLLLWIMGMRACGPLRALLMDGAELPLFYILAVASGKENRSRSKSRGAIVMLLAYVLLIYDASGRAPKGQTALEKTKVGQRVELEVDRLRDTAQDTINTVREKADEAAKQIRDKNLLFVGSQEEAEQVDPENALVPRSDDEDAGAENDNQKGDDNEDKRKGNNPNAMKDDRDGVENDLANDKVADEDEKQANDQGARRRLLFEDVGSDSEEDQDGPDDRDDDNRRPVPGVDAFDNEAGGLRKLPKNDRADQEDYEDDETYENQIPGGLQSEVGVVLVLIASLINQLTRGHTRKLAAELGGPKRQFALTVGAASFTVAPVMIVCELYGGRPFPTVFTVGTGNIVGLAMIGFLWLVLPYYIRAVLTNRLEQAKLLRAGMMVTFSVASLLWLIFAAGSRAGGMSVTLVVAFFLLVVGINMMTLTTARETSSLPFDKRDERAE